MRRARTFALVVATALAMAACDSKQAPPPPESSVPLPASAPSPPIATETPAAAAPSAAASAGPSSYAGEWIGKYEAKKGKIDLPKDLNRRRESDDGKSAVGPGTLKIMVSRDGEVRGSIDGALGRGTISGVVEGDALRGSIFPDEHGDKAMAGIVVGIVKGGVISGEIHVSGPDASVVREGAFELRRK